MAYRKIQNLYKDKRVLDLKEVYACEKIHGSSAHISYDKSRVGDKLCLYSGGCKEETFDAIFDKGKLVRSIASSIAQGQVVIFGEVYGSKMQAMSATYGKELKFVAFEVKIGERWLSVIEAERVVVACGLEFVPYRRIPATLEAINKERDRASEQAMRNGAGNHKMREGVVLYPLIVMYDNRGNRIITKHKREEFSETRTKREVSPEKLKVLTNAKNVAHEWVTPMRLAHVLDGLDDPCIENMKYIIFAMVKDVKEESEGEVVWSKAVEKAIGSRTAHIYKLKLNEDISKEVKEVSGLDKLKRIFKKD